MEIFFDPSVTIPGKLFDVIHFERFPLATCIGGKNQMKYYQFMIKIDSLLAEGGEMWVECGIALDQLEALESIFSSSDFQFTYILGLDTSWSDSLEYGTHYAIMIAKKEGSTGIWV